MNSLSTCKPAPWGEQRECVAVYDISDPKGNDLDERQATYGLFPGEPSAFGEAITVYHMGERLSTTKNKPYSTCSCSCNQLYSISPPPFSAREITRQDADYGNQVYIINTHTHRSQSGVFSPEVRI